LPLRKKVIEDVSALFGVLAHPTRVRILALLHHAELDVSDLSSRLEVPATNVSQHLAVLRSHHLVALRREGARAHYSLRDPRVGDIINRALDILAEDISLAPEIQKAIELVRLKP
jgi:DNA-binding transcriptional ArsR family regulator